MALAFPWSSPHDLAVLTACLGSSRTALLLSLWLVDPAGSWVLSGLRRLLLSREAKCFFAVSEIAGGKDVSSHPACAMEKETVFEESEVAARPLGARCERPFRGVKGGEETRTRQGVVRKQWTRCGVVDGQVPP